MNKAYWIVRADITDTEKFKHYISKTPAVLESFNAKFLARAGKYEVVEGETRSRNTIIEFPSYEKAMACYRSEEYQSARQQRLGGADIDIVIVEGCGAE